MPFSRTKYLYTVVILENEVVVKTLDLESVGGTYLFKKKCDSYDNLQHGFLK